MLAVGALGAGLAAWLGAWLAAERSKRLGPAPHGRRQVASEEVRRYPPRGTEVTASSAQRLGAWVPMRTYDDAKEVDFTIVGVTGEVYGTTGGNGTA